MEVTAGTSESESPTTKEAPAKAKKPTPTQVKAELEDLKAVANQRQQRIRDTEIKIQRCRDILKKEGTPGMSLVQDHYRLKGMVDDLRQLLNVVPEDIGG
jgi:hypothetical protein